MHRRLLSLLFLIGALHPLPLRAEPPYKITHRSTTLLAPSAKDQSDQPFDVRGLSGIAWLGGERFVAAMDNSNKLVFLAIRVGTDGTLLSAKITGGLSLGEGRDFEGVAPATTTSVFLADEGPLGGSDHNGRNDLPSVREYSLADGSLI